MTIMHVKFKKNEYETVGGAAHTKTNYPFTFIFKMSEKHFQTMVKTPVKFQKYQEEELCTQRSNIHSLSLSNCQKKVTKNKLKIILK